MGYIWIKDGVQFKNPLEYNGRKIINPSEQLLEEAGYQKVSAPIVNEKNIIEVCSGLPSASQQYENKTYLNEIDKEFYICTNENNSYQWKSVNYYNKDIFDKNFILTNNSWLETYKSTVVSSKFVVREDAKIIYPTQDNTNFHQKRNIQLFKSILINSLYIDSIKEIPMVLNDPDVTPNFILPAGYTSANLQDAVRDFGAISFRGRYNNSLAPRLFIDCDESIITGRVLDSSGNIATEPSDLREIRNEFHMYNTSGKPVTTTSTLNQGNRPVFRICTRMRN